MTGKRIVIVEDTAPIAEALQLKLKAIGHDVVVCDDGELAVAEITKQKPDLVVSDIIMPKIDGFGVVAAAKKAHPDVKIVIFSDLAQEEDHKRMMDLGVKDYIVKSATSLSDAVKKIDAYATGKDPNAKSVVVPSLVSKPVSEKDSPIPKTVSKEMPKPVSIPNHIPTHSSSATHQSLKTPANPASHAPAPIIHASSGNHAPEHPPLVVPKPPKKVLAPLEKGQDGHKTGLDLPSGSRHEIEKK